MFALEFARRNATISGALLVLVALAWFFGNRWVAAAVAILAMPLLTALYNTQQREHRARSAAITRPQSQSQSQSNRQPLPMRDLASRNPGIVYSVQHKLD
jgi:hypothetical protein